MIKQNAVDSALLAEQIRVSAGKNLDLEISQETSRVSRSRQYRVYLPAGYNETKRYPLIMILHGCRQNHLDIQSITGFNAIADRVGAVLVYPFVTSYAGIRSQNCWGWWLSRQRQRGRGEVSDLRRIAQDVMSTFAVDTTQKFICGLSAGGAMSVASLAAYSDFWTGGASVAGVPYGESERAVRVNSHLPVRRKTVSTLTRVLSRELVSEAPPVLIVQSEADKMVGPALGESIRDSWLGVSDCEQQASLVYTDVTRGIGWRLEQYRSKAKVQVAHFLLDKVDHGWPGGLPGQYCFPEAPNVSELIWAFFEHTACANLP